MLIVGKQEKRNKNDIVETTIYNITSPNQKTKRQNLGGKCYFLNLCGKI